MKIEQKKGKIEPIVITIETVEEATQMWDMADSIHNELSVKISTAFSETLDVPK